MIALLLASLLVGGSRSPSSGSEPLPKLAVLPLKPMRMPAETAKILDELLIGTLDAIDRYEIITGQDINAMLSLERMKDAVGCDNVACAAEIGGALGVDWLMTGSASRLGDQMSIALALIDIKNARVAERGRASVADDENNYVDAVRSAAAQVMGVQGPASSGSRAGSAGTMLRLETRSSEQFDVSLVSNDGVSTKCTIRRDSPCVLRDLMPGKFDYVLASGGHSDETGSLKLVPADAVVMKVKSRVSIASIALWGSGGGLGFMGLFFAGFGKLADSGGLQTAGLVVAGAGLVTAAIGIFLPDTIVVDKQEVHGVVE